MDISILTKKMNDFIQSKGWYEKHSSRPQTLRNLIISLNLEASEMLEIFQWDEHPDRKNELEDELADVALYLFQIANVAGVDLEAAIIKKLD